MPLYEYVCRESHRTELLRHRDVEAVLCACGEPAVRVAVNHIGFTGFAETPRDQKSYRQSFKEYKEASAEVDYAYTRAENNGDPVKSPNLYQEGLKQARAIDPSLRI